MLCLARDPAERFPTASALAAAARRYLSGRDPGPRESQTLLPLVRAHLKLYQTDEEAAQKLLQTLF